MKIGDLFPIIAVVICSCIFGWMVVDIAQSTASSPKEPKLYTVQTADAVYTDLMLIRSTNHGAIYRTQTGKEMVFRGTFAEIEQ